MDRTLLSADFDLVVAARTGRARLPVVPLRRITRVTLSRVLNRKARISAVMAIPAGGRPGHHARAVDEHIVAFRFFYATKIKT